MKKASPYVFYGGILLLATILAYTSIRDSQGEKTTAVSGQQSSSKTVEAQPVKPAEKIQVYMFHATNRCYSCTTIGKYTKETIEEFFQPELRDGKIEFKEINIDLPENKEIAAKFKAAGSSLFINPIIDGQDNIKEDTQVWRLVSNKQAFASYLTETLKALL